MNETEAYTNGLASIVYEKTLGNAFFVVQFLKALVNDDLLEYNEDVMKWMWQDGEIQALSVADNVGSLLAAKIQRLPRASQVLLKVTSMLGQTLDEETL